MVISVNLYKYTATDAAGKTVRGRETAEDNFELVQKLRSKNLYCTTYSRVENKLDKQDAKYKMKLKDLAFFSRQLSTMLTAGISLVRALNILYSQQENKKQKALILAVYEEVQKGKSFSEALVMQKNAFPGLFLSMVAAGEASGNLDTIMMRVSDHYAKENKTRNKVKGAMMYPIILGIIMIAVIVILFTFVMPMFLEMFGDKELPPMTQVLMAISGSMTSYWYLYIGFTVGIVLTVRIALRVPSVRVKFDRMKCKIPKAGKLICTVYTARFARTMSNLFSSGLQMVDCIQKSVQTLNNAYISKEFETVVENVKQGENLSSAVAKTGIFDGVFTSIVYVGEESGTLDGILGKAADYYDDESDSAITKLVEMLPPLLIMVLGGLVGAVLMGIFPALYGSYGSMLN